MEAGGLHNVLKEIITFLDGKYSLSFTHSDIVRITGLSDSSVTKNLSRLLKHGYINREFYYKANDDGRYGRYCRYTITGPDVINFVKEVLFDEK